MPRKMSLFALFIPFLLLLPFLELPVCASDRPTVRVITGVREINNWQGDLVKRNANLSHWHWNPVYVYQQGLLLTNKSQNLGVKPNYAAALKLPEKLSTRHYVKPIHVPFSPNATVRFSSSDSISSKLVNESLSGQLEQNLVAQPSIKKVVPPSTRDSLQYAPAYSYGGKRSAASVHGQLKSKKICGLRAQAKLIYRSGAP